MNSSTDQVAKVFISYCHYDGETDYRPRIAELSAELRSNGIDVHIDQYEEHDPPASWPRWMTQQIQNAQYVLVCCSETYCRRFQGIEEPGIGLGAVWEGEAITGTLYNESHEKHKFIPIHYGRREDFRAYIPSPLDTTSSYNIDSASGFSQLLRRLHSQPKIVIPPIGTKPNFQNLDEPPPDLKNSIVRTIERKLGNSALYSEIQNAYNELVEVTHEDVLKILESINYSERPIDSTYGNLCKEIESAVMPLCSTTANLFKFHQREFKTLIQSTIRQFIFQESTPQTTFAVWASLRNYPAAILTYSFGISAFVYEDFETLAKAANLKIHDKYDFTKSYLLIPSLTSHAIFHYASTMLDVPIINAKFPGSEYFRLVLLKTLSKVLKPDKISTCFDQFEYFISLVAFQENKSYIMPGRFVYIACGGQDRHFALASPFISGLNDTSDWSGFLIFQNTTHFTSLFNEHFEKIKTCDLMR